MSVGTADEVMVGTLSSAKRTRKKRRHSDKQSLTEQTHIYTKSDAPQTEKNSIQSKAIITKEMNNRKHGVIVQERVVIQPTKRYPFKKQKNKENGQLLNTHAKVHLLICLLSLALTCACVLTLLVGFV